MKICSAQIRPVKGDIERNIQNHKRLIDLAVANGADIVFFPELSLTSYDIGLSKKLATNQDDKRLDVFQTISDAKDIVICVGLPTNCNLGIQISMVIFQPNKTRQTYSKLHLHSDEFPYFVSGQQQIIINVQNKKIAPAICYESMLTEHTEKTFKLGAEVYMASVADSFNGVTKAFAHYPIIAKQYAMTVIMSNCIGPCDDFESVGNSAIWNKDGVLLGQLNDSSEGLLVFDTETEEIIKLTDLKTLENQE